MGVWDNVCDSVKRPWLLKMWNRCKHPFDLFKAGYVAGECTGLVTKEQSPPNFGHPHLQYLFNATDYFHSIVSLYLLMLYMTWWFGWPPTRFESNINLQFGQVVIYVMIRTLHALSPNLHLTRYFFYTLHLFTCFHIFPRFLKGQVWREFLLVRAAEKFEPLAWGSVCERAGGNAEHVLRVIGSHRSLQWVIGGK